MANSARDPYWQGSVRRETIDHPGSSAAIQSECASCHMPLQYQQDKAQKRETAFSAAAAPNNHAATRPGRRRLLRRLSSDPGCRPGHTRNLQRQLRRGPARNQSASVFGPCAGLRQHHQSPHHGRRLTPSRPRKSATPASAVVATLSTPRTRPRRQTRRPASRADALPRVAAQRLSRQADLPAVPHARGSEPVAVASLLGKPREGVRQHTFVGANFLLEGMLGAHRDDLAVTAQPSDIGRRHRAHHVIPAIAVRARYTRPRLN